MTRQEAFDTVWNYFVVQKNPYSVDDENTCQYRGTNGSKCAIGCLIPDNMYKEEMEEYPSALGLRRVFPEVGELLTGLGSGFLNSLQAAHDDAADSTIERGDDEEFTYIVKDSLRIIADDYMLEVPT